LTDIGSLIAYFVAAFAIVKNLSSESSAATRAGSRGLLNMVRHFLMLEVTMNQRRTSNSPLLDPSFCTVVLISPDALDQGPADPSTPATCKRATEIIAKAAEIAGVPVFVLSDRHLEQQLSSSPALSSMRGHVRFVFEQHTSPWSHQAFVEALSAQDRTILILAGLWLEHEILATALNALVDGYDVYVLLDGSAPRSPLACAVARERLSQAGGTAITTAQVISEWAFETTDASMRAALMALLPVLLDLKPSGS
jgi:nicotinamidase-related amidase